MKPRLFGAICQHLQMRKFQKSVSSPGLESLWRSLEWNLLKQRMCVYLFIGNWDLFPIVPAVTGGWSTCRITLGRSADSAGVGTFLWANPGTSPNHRHGSFFCTATKPLRRTGFAGWPHAHMILPPRLGTVSVSLGRTCRTHLATCVYQAAYRRFAILSWGN